MPEETKRPEWTRVATETTRLVVPGGWLYRTQSQGYSENSPLAEALCFVPWDGRDREHPMYFAED